MRAFFLVVAALVFLQAPARAGFFVGNETLDNCEKDVTFCLGYMSGVFDGMDWGASMVGREYCPPDGYILSQVKDIVVAYLRRHPENLQLPAPQLFLLALREAWPC